MENHPITLSDSKPEPDLAVIRAGNYDQRHPGAVDTLLVIEFADSSLEKDLEEKRLAYAQAESSPSLRIRATNNGFSWHSMWQPVRLWVFMSVSVLSKMPASYGIHCQVSIVSVLLPTLIFGMPMAVFFRANATMRWARKRGKLATLSGSTARCDSESLAWCVRPFRFQKSSPIILALSGCLFTTTMHPYTTRTT
jgi:hypothetical protein